MPSFVSTVLPVVVLVGVIHLAILLIESRKKSKKRQAQMGTETLRGPGQSLLIRLDNTNGVIHGCYTYLFAVPLAVIVAHLFVSYILDMPESLVRSLVSGGIALVYLFGCIGRLMMLRAKRNAYLHAYDGEVAVAKELNRLMEEGYYVYHDFPADQFHIDHIVIGPTGVMAVETKTRSKSSARNRELEPVVTYDGRMLHFPKYSDYEVIEKAKHQAAWLSEWIASTVGEDIAARAMVVLPGWSVKRTSADGIPVVNPSQIETLFKHIKPRPLTKGQMASIVSEIDRQCRNSAIDGNVCYMVAT